MAVVVKDGALRTVLRGAAAVKTATGHGNRAAPTQVLDLGTRMALLVAVLDSIIQYNNKTAVLDLREYVVKELSRPFDDVQLDPASWRELSGAVDRTFELALRLGPPLKGLAVMEDPARWLPGVAQEISKAAVKAGSMYANALSRSWREGEQGLNFALENAEAAAAGLPRLITKLYVGPHGVHQQLNEIDRLRDQLIAMKDDSGRSPWGTDPNTPIAVTQTLSDVGITSLYPGTQDWTLMHLLREQHARALLKWQNGTPGKDEEIQDLCRRAQRISVTLIALILEEQLTTFRDSLRVRPFVDKTRLTGYYDRLLPALAALHQSFSGPDATGQVAALTALRLLIDDPDLRADTETALTALAIFKQVEEVLLVAAIAVAAAYTAGAAASLALGAITALAGEAAVGGVTWAAIGSFAVEQFTVTATTRFGNELLFGGSAVNTTFWEDLRWNAVGAVFGKAVKAGVGASFSRTRAEWPAAFAKLEFATEQISTFGFGQAQRYAQSGEFATGEQASRAALDQIVQLGLTMLTSRLTKSLSSRTSNLSIDPADLTDADLRSADLRTLVTKVNNGTATQEETLSLPAKIEEVRNAEVVIIKQLLDSPAKTAKLAEYTGEAAQLQLHMARLGLPAGTSVPGQEPAFTPKQTGVITVSEAAEPVLKKFVADRDGEITDGPEGTESRKVTLPTGHVTFVVPAGASDPVPPPTDLEAATGEAIVSSSVSEPSTQGLANLQRLYTGKATVQSILSAVRGSGEAQSSLVAFERMMAHPEFATLTGKPAVAVIIAFGRSANLRDFLGLYGPRLALAIRSKLKIGDSRNNKTLIDAYARIESLIEGTPEAQRSAYIEQLIGMKAVSMRALLTGPGPVKEPKVKIDAETAGVNPKSKQWKSALAWFEAKYPKESIKVKEARASVQQILEIAQARRYYNLPYTTQLAILAKLDTFCKEAKYDEGGYKGPWNNVYGAVIEWMALPKGAGNKTAWYKGSNKNIPRRRSDVTIPDDWDVANGVGVQTEVKGNRIHYPALVNPLEAARKHYAEALADATNIPTGSVIQIHYFHIPPAAFQHQIIDYFSQVGSPIKRVRFGPGKWLDVPVKGGPPSPPFP